MSLTEQSTSISAAAKEIFEEVNAQKKTLETLLGNTKNVSSLIEKLKSKGFIINDENLCKTKLSQIGYYRLSAYFSPIKTGQEHSINIDDVFNIYNFDRELRIILLSALEVIEISTRSKLAYFHSQQYGPLGYLSSTTFNNKHNDSRFKELIKKLIDKHENLAFVKHHIEKYNGFFPLWVISELFTFGFISSFYDDLITADKKKLFGNKYKNMTSWLRCCSDLRNICAHYGRLYCRVFTAMPSGFDISDYDKRRLWGAILCMKELYPSSNDWNEQVILALTNLFEKYNDIVNLECISFPNDWQILLRK